MTGKREVLGALVCAMIAAACAGGDTAAEPSATAATVAAAPDGSGPTEAKTDVAVPSVVPSEPVTAPSGASEESTAVPTDPALDPAPTDPSPDPADPDLADQILEDRSAVARELDPPEGGFDEGTVFIEEDFQSTTPRVAPLETDAGTGGIGSFDDRRFYEVVLTDPESRVAAPLTGLDAADSEQVYIQQVSFVSNFEGLPRMDRGVYCWASNGNDPLAGSRYEMLFTQDARIQVIRYGADGSPEALVIDEPYDFAVEAAAPDPGGLEPIQDVADAARIGLLCRPDAEGRAQVAARVERAYYVTTDSGGPRPGGGAGIVAYGGGTAASTASITTFDAIFVLDGAQVPLQ